MRTILELRMGASPKTYIDPEMSEQHLYSVGSRTQCTTFAVADAIGRIETGPARKISIYIMKYTPADKAWTDLDISRPGDRWISGATDAMIINRYLDLSEYFASTEPRRIVFEALQSDLIATAEKYDWDVDQIRTACETVSRTDLTFYKEFGTPVLSPNRKRRATAFIQADEWTGSIHFRIEDVETGNTRTILGLQEDEFWTDYYWKGIGARWVGSDRITFAVKSKHLPFEPVTVP